MNKVATLTITLLNILLAQSIDMDKFKNMKARSIGPAGMSGRVTAIEVLPVTYTHLTLPTTEYV